MNIIDTRKFIWKTLENQPFFRLHISIYIKSSSVYLTNPGMWARSSALASKSDFKTRIKYAFWHNNDGNDGAGIEGWATFERKMMFLPLFFRALPILKIVWLILMKV